MIKATFLSDGHIDCQLAGLHPQILAEYNGVVMGLIKMLREKEHKTDEEIEKLLIESIDLAFRVLDAPGGVKEVI